MEERSPKVEYLSYYSIVEQMCSQYLIKTRLSDLQRNFGIVVPGNYGLGEDINLFIAPYQNAPVIVMDQKGLVLKFMSFSLIPSWSKTKRLKFSTHNARVDTVAEKPTWKKSFVNRRAVVPLSGFVEPIYVKEFAGNMVEFFDKNHRVLYAAAIWDEWIDKQNGEVVESFAILTDNPYPSVESIGHDRSPLFLNDEAIAGWLNPEESNPKTLLTYLSQNRLVPDLDCKSYRPLKPGWEKRLEKKTKAS